MLHRDKEEFLKILERASAKTGFPLRMLEKDYYLTIILSKINEELSSNLIFKGGTCLNKIYYSYYRLSEDLDFTLKLPKSQNDTTRIMRRNAMKKIKENITSFAENFDMKLEDEKNAGRNLSTQYVYYLKYNSVVLNKVDSIKLEIGLRFNPILQEERHNITYQFLHPFTGEPLFPPGSVLCLPLKELVAEKMRAATTRREIAPRDFFDLGFLLKKNFNFRNNEFLEIFKKKLKEDNFSNDLKKYSYNLGRTEKEIDEMKSRLKDELFSVLTIKESKSFNLDKMLNRFNQIFIGVG